MIQIHVDNITTYPMHGDKVYNILHVYFFEIIKPTT